MMRRRPARRVRRQLPLEILAESIAAVGSCSPAARVRHDPLAREAVELVSDDHIGAAGSARATGGAAPSKSRASQ